MSAIFFFSLAILYIAMIVLSHKAVNGMGEMRKTMRHFTVFMLDKAPAGVIDLFSKKEGSGSRTWIIHGALWATVAATIGFLNIWLKYDAQALDSLSSIGWKYNADVMSGFSETSLMFGFLFMTFIGATLHILPRANGGKLASEANASLMAFAWSGILFFTLLILPLLLKFELLGNLTGLQLLFFPSAIQMAMAMILGALLLNLLLALGERTPSTSLSASSWFIILSYISVIWAFIIRGSFLALYGNVTPSLLGDISSYQQLISGDASSVVWMADRVVTGWFPLAMMLAIAYHVIPSISGSPIWSRSLSIVSFTTLFFSVPVLMMSNAALVDDTLLSVAAVLVVLGLVPLLASSSNLIATMQGRWEKVLASPGGAASASAVLLLPIIALMGFFSSLDEINGAHNMGGVQGTVDHGLLWLVGGLMALAVWGRIFPEVVSRRLSSRSKARWAFWLFLVGGFGSTISMLMADFASISLTDAGVEDVSSHLGGYYLTSAALFYALVIGTFVATVNLVSTLFSDEVDADKAPVSSGMDSFELQPGNTSIRDLVSKGVGVDTVIIIRAASEEDEEDEDSTEVGVSASLHTDEGVVMPKAEPIKAAPVDALAAFHPELIDLATWLKSSGTTTIDLFMKMDLDSDGNISPFEIREGLASLDIVDLPPWDVEKLVTSMDLDGDGKINIPELDIHMMRIMNSLAAEDGGKDSTDEEDEDEDEDEDDSLDEASLSSMKKAELVALAEERGISSKGKKSEIIARLCE